MIEKGRKKAGHPRYSQGCPITLRRYAISIDDVLMWRKRWDSNPRALADNCISSAARYDHFDTLPSIMIHFVTGSTLPAGIHCGRPVHALRPLTLPMETVRYGIAGRHFRRTYSSIPQFPLPFNQNRKRNRRCRQKNFRMSAEHSAGAPVWPRSFGCPAFLFGKQTGKQTGRADRPSRPVSRPVA